MKKHVDAKRIQFGFSEEAVARMEALMKRTGCVSYAELTRASYRLLEYMLDVSEADWIEDEALFRDWVKRTVRMVVSE